MSNDIPQKQAITLQSGEIDLREIARFIWGGRLLILSVTTLFTIASILYALSMPDEYRSTVLLAPVSASNSSSISRLAGQYGGLASLAGISLGGNSDNKVVIAMEIIKTWGFLESFIQKYNLQVAVFAAKGWDRSRNKLLIDPELYDEANNRWVTKGQGNGESLEPSSWVLYKRFVGKISINQDKITGLISLSLESYSPELAKEWVEKLVKEINFNLQKRDRDDAVKSIQYLQNKIKETNISDMQTVFYQLIEEQTKTLMLAEVSDEYVFKTISPARIAEEKVKPKRVLVVLLGGMLGGMLSVSVIFVRYFLAKGKIE